MGLSTRSASRAGCMYNPTTPDKRQMPVKICYSFVARHAPQYGEWIVEIREMREWNLLCVFGRVRYCWSLPDKIMLPQISGNSCYSHRVAELTDDQNIAPMVGYSRRPTDEIQIHKTPPKSDCNVAFSKVVICHLYSQSDLPVIRPTFCRSFIIVMSTWYRSKHSRQRNSTVFSFVCKIRFSLVCFLYMPTLVN